jgi:hypothetical protein
MIDITTFKKSLGEIAKDLTDTDIKKLMDVEYKLANVFFDMFVKKSKIKENNTVFVKYKKDGNLIFMYGKVYA